MTQEYTNFKLKVDAVISTTLESHLPIPEDVIKGIQDIPAFRPIRFANIIGEIMRVKYNPLICAMVEYNDRIARIKEFRRDTMNRSTFGRWFEWNRDQYSKNNLLEQLTILIKTIKISGRRLVWKLRDASKDITDEVIWTSLRDKARVCIKIKDSDAPNPLAPAVDIVPTPITLRELQSVERAANQPTTPVGDTYVGDAYEPIDIGPIC